MDVMTHPPNDEVYARIRSTDTRLGRRARLHRLGRYSRSAALRAAQEVYDAARAAAEAGHEIPHGGSGGWSACGYRPGWELDWPAAMVLEPPGQLAQLQPLPDVALPRDRRSRRPNQFARPGPTQPVRDERGDPQYGLRPARVGPVWPAHTSDHRRCSRGDPSQNTRSCSISDGTIASCFLRFKPSFSRFTIGCISGRPSKSAGWTATNIRVSAGR